MISASTVVVVMANQYRVARGWRKWLARRVWELTEPLQVNFHGIRITTPAGRRTDFASVPRPVQWLLSEAAVYSVGAVTHDQLYFEGRVSRAVADAVFLELLAWEGIGRFDRWVMYLAVRMFGRGAWRRHRRLGHPERNAGIF